MALSPNKRPHRIRFERQAVTDDGHGNVTAGWDAPVVVATRWAGFLLPPRFGVEQVEAGRLQGSLRGVVTVLRDSDTDGITEADRVVFQTAPYAGSVAQIRLVRPRPDNAEIEFDIEIGPAT